MKGLLACLLLPAGLAQAVRVYLSPSPSLPSELSPKQASFALSRHLDLESFESFDEDSIIWDAPLHQEFVGQGPKDGLLLTIGESHVHGTFPSLLSIFMQLTADLTRTGTVLNRRHSEETESNFRGSFHLLSRFSRFVNLDLPPSRPLYVLPNILRSILPHTRSPSNTRYFLRTFDCHWDFHV